MILLDAHCPCGAECIVRSKVYSRGPSGWILRRIHRRVSAKLASTFMDVHGEHHPSIKLDS